MIHGIDTSVAHHAMMSPGWLYFITAFAMSSPELFQIVYCFVPIFENAFHLFRYTIKTPIFQAFSLTTIPTDTVLKLLQVFSLFVLLSHPFDILNTQHDVK